MACDKIMTDCERVPDNKIISTCEYVHAAVFPFPYGYDVSFYAKKGNSIKRSAHYDTVKNFITWMTNGVFDQVVSWWKIEDELRRLGNILSHHSNTHEHILFHKEHST